MSVWWEVWRTLAPRVFVGQMQKPSWCRVVRQPHVILADFAAAAHWSVSRAVG